MTAKERRALVEWVAARVFNFDDLKDWPGCVKSAYQGGPMSRRLKQVRQVSSGIIARVEKAARRG